MKHLKKYIIFLIAFSSCTTTLPINFCYIEEQGLRCFDYKVKKYYNLPFKQAINYVAISPKDAEFLVTYLKTKCHK